MLILVLCMSLVALVAQRGIDDQIDLQLLTAAEYDVETWQVGQALPPLRLATSSGEIFDSEAIKANDQATLLYFFDSTRQYAQLQLPEIAQLDHRVDDLAVWLIHRSDLEPTATGVDFVTQLGLELNIASGELETYLATGGIGMPVLVFVDKSGIVREIFYGYMDLETIDTNLALLGVK